MSEKTKLIKIHDLTPPQGAHRPKRRVARGTAGHGGKTAGRGTKGQKARGSVKPGFEGGQLPLTQRIPKLRGFANPFRVSYQPINLDILERFSGDIASLEALRSAGLVRKGALVKVLGRGQLSRPLVVQAHAFSESAKSAIEAAGGRWEVLEKPFKGPRPPVRGNALANR
jgi:large subunit ribosomal protein L15